jgi:hypothetical protein
MQPSWLTSNELKGLSVRLTECVSQFITYVCPSHPLDCLETWEQQVGVAARANAETGADLAEREKALVHQLSTLAFTSAGATATAGNKRARVEDAAPSRLSPIQVGDSEELESADLQKSDTNKRPRAPAHFRALHQIGNLCTCVTPTHSVIDGFHKFSWVDSGAANSGKKLFSNMRLAL